MKVRLFKTTTCPYCHMETEWLKENKVSFEEIYVDRDPAAAEDMIHQSGQMGVPVTEITDGGRTEYILGFDKPRLSKLLNISA